MKVSALKTISMNKEDKESVHNILWMCEKWYHYCEPCMCSHPLTLHISATFFAKQSGREIIFLSPLPDPCPCCHDKKRKWDKFTDQAKGQISRLKIFIQSSNLSGIEKGSLKKLVQIIESVFLSLWCDTSQSENTRFGKLDILRYRLLVLIFTIRLGGSAQYSAVVL